MAYEWWIIPLSISVFIGMSVLTVPLAVALFFALQVMAMGDASAFTPEFIQNYSLAVRLNSSALISIPLFALAGELAVASGITGVLLELAERLGSGGRHSLPNQTFLGAAMFACVSGVGSSAMDEQSKRLIPRCLFHGRDPSTTTGMLAAAATLTIVIPASVPQTIYAATAHFPTNIIFTASFVPGLILAAMLYITALLCDRRSSTKPTVTRYVVSRRTALWRAKWALALPVLILTGLFTGMVTAPEAAAIACFYAVIHGRRTGSALNADTVGRAVIRSATTASAVLLLAAVGGLFVQFCQAHALVERMSAAIYSACGGRFGSLIWINAVLLAAGCLIDIPAIICLMVPLLLPLARMSGMHDASIGVMVVLNLAIGLITPPHAPNLTVAARDTGSTPGQAARQVWPYFLAMITGLALVSAFPELSIWLPARMGWLE